MEKSNNENSYRLDVARVNKVPKSRLSARVCEESDGAPSTSAVRKVSPPPTARLGNPTDQDTPDPGPQQNINRSTRGKRQNKLIRWSNEEKEKILFCHTYSGYEKWGRRGKEVFEEKIREAGLPSEKIEATTIPKLRSIVSRIHYHLNKEKIDEIRAESLSQAKRDFENMQEEKKEEYSKSKWTREENWVVLWATEYAKTKLDHQFERKKEWQRIFNHHCPQKRNIPPSRINTQKFNIKDRKIFTDDEISTMHEKINYMIRNNICPLERPIQMPGQTRETNPAHQGSPEVSDEDLQDHQERRPTPIPQDQLPRQTSPEPPDSPSSSSSDDSPERPRPRGGNGRSPTPPRPPNIQDEPDQEQQDLEEELANKIEEVSWKNLNDRVKLIKLKENKKLKALIKRVNTGLTKIVPKTSTLTQLNQASYGAAWYVQSRMAPGFAEKTSSNNKKRNQTPKWKYDKTTKINKLRAEVSQIKTYMQLQEHPRKLQRKIEKIKKEYKVGEQQLNGLIAEHQAKIKALAAQIKNTETKINEKRINKQFAENPRLVYRNLACNTIEVKEPPRLEDIEGYWRPLYEDPTQHQEPRWIDTIKEKNRNKPIMPELTITEDKLRRKINEYHNFKAPGTDKIPNFWLKKLTALHPHYLLAFTRIIKREEETPEWLTTGMTTLIPKSEETKQPDKYRPICCLTTTYKWLTGIIGDAIYDHLEHGNYLENEQKGCVRNRLGTKDQLLINKTILEDCRKRKRNLSMAWIDYKKAFDSVPHSWVLKCLELYNINKDLTAFLKEQMTQWKTTMYLNHEEGQLMVPNIKILRGIFQGDSLSPLLFCLALDPLSKILKANSIGYDLSRGRSRKAEKKKVNHLLFMDDLKIYAESNEKLAQLVEVVSEFSRDINMEFGLDKCSKCTIKKGSKIEAEDIQVGEGSYIEDLTADSTYRYLGIEENETIEHKKMREKIRKEYLRRLKKICKSDLTPKNKITAINQYAVPVVTYGFGVVNWPQVEINKLDVKTRKMLTLHKITYRNQCLDRIYLPRREGGLGLTEIDQAHKASIISISQYLESSEEEIIKIVTEHHKEALSQQTSIIKMASNFGGDIITEREGHEQTPATALARKTRAKYTKREETLRAERWLQHQRAGKFKEELEKEYIDKDGSLQWLNNGAQRYDGERIIVAAQDQGLVTNSFKKLVGMSQNDKCRFCGEAVESVNHLVSGCKILLADGQYTNRHNKICTYIHWKICKEYNIAVNDKSWEHEPQPSLSTEEVNIYYDKIIPAGRYIEGGAVKPDIVIWNKHERTAKIVEITVPNDFGLNRAERTKRTKYQDLMYDLRRTWSLNEVEIIPVVIGATGLMKKNLKSLLERIPGCPSAYEVQLTAIKGTASILRRALGYGTYAN